jgi:scyllo-inositol 2-dehydrogenase (NADP+)
LVGVVRRAADPVEGDVPVYTSLRAALDQRPDLAIISTPHHLHHEQARLCLESGCHLLVEKPLALRYAQAAELHDLAKVKRRFLVVRLQRRYEGFSAIFRETVAVGDLGRVELVHGFFAHRFAPGGLEGWRADPELVGAGILDDSAIHLIDLLLSFASGRVRAADGRLLDRSSPFIRVPS